MKPLRLTIEGLNSFEQREVIDFERLMEPGLFGIFGATGSGKSSIIDGMTLALFGDVSRGSKNFINVNGDKCHVILEFQIGAHEAKQYKVSRSYKRDKGTGNARADKARLECMDKNGESEILADQTRAVDEECSMILGLSKDDFTRTVILPQGKFSEFLQMGGKDRTDMLERIFQLEKFGVELDKRVKNHRSRLEEDVKVLEGQRQTYEGISTEKLKEKQEEYEKKKGEVKQTEEKITAIQKFEEEWKHVREAQQKQEKNRGRRKELQLLEPEIEESKKQLEDAKTANELYVLYKEETVSGKKYLDIRQNREAKELQKKRVEEEALAAKTKAEFSRQQFHEEKPKLENSLSQMDAAIEKVRELDSLEINLKQTIENQKQNRLAQVQLKQQALEENNRLEQIKEQMKAFEEEKSRRFHSQQEKNLVQEGAEAEKEINRLEKEIAAAKISQSNQTRQKNELNEEIQQALTDLVNRKTELSKLETELIKLDEELFSFPDIAERKIIAERARMVQQTEEELKKELKAAARILETAISQMIELEKTEQDVQSERETVQTVLQELQKQTLAQKLAAGLKEDEPCPVCGSIHHTKTEAEFLDEQKLSEEEEAVKSQMAAVDQKSDEIKMQKMKAQTDKARAESTIQEAREKENRLDQELLRMDLKQKDEELVVLVQKKENLEKKQQELRKQCDKKREEIGEVNNTIGKKQTLFLTLEGNLKDWEQKLTDLTSQIKHQIQIQNQCLAKMQVESFVLQWEKIGSDTEQYEKAEKQLRLGNQENGKLIESIQKKNDQIIKMKEDCIRYEESETSQKESIERIRRELEDTVKTWEDLPQRKEAVSQKLQQLQKDSELAERQQNLMEKKKQKTLEEYQKLSVEEGKIEGIFSTNKHRLETRMQEAGIMERDWILDHHTEEGLLSDLEQKIKNHRDQVLHIEKVLQELEAELAGRSISEEEWVEKTGKLKELQELQKQQNSECSVLKSESQRIEKDLEQLSSILKKLEEAEHQKSLVSELEKLLRGKAFVRFASMYYLKFITKDANKRLREMTNGNYELELSENGEFLMRDYKNGGKIRPCTTLSGGETFIVSLALALALSKQVQLKGATSIDLFFLDEGFGTLDERFIDVVMDSLYRLRERGLHVGLITHVEAIKDRIGARILVTPAESGGKGSKIALEFS